MLLAISALSPTLFAVLVVVGLILAVVHLVMARGASVLGWGCALVFLALSINALAATEY